MTEKRSCEILVVGSGPAGQKAAITAAHQGREVVLIEQERNVGGACVHRGTIPSKTLRETAMSLQSFKQRTAGVFDVNEREDLQVASLMTRMERVIKAHEKYQGEQLGRSGVEWLHGRCELLDDHHARVTSVSGGAFDVRADIIVIATGSEPRNPEHVAIDHKHILDSDSILSMIYLPESLVVLGAGVIAVEYAAIFAALGVKVTMIDRNERPLAFLDPELSEFFLDSFRAKGGIYHGETEVAEVAFDGAAEVITGLIGGQTIRSEKLLCCLGRVANVRGLNLEAAGVELTRRGLIGVNSHFQTNVPHIYAVGDVIGPPSLASTSMEQGRRAMFHALGMPEPSGGALLPMGIYTIPEISSIGLSEQDAIDRYGEVLVGRARFDEVARGQIAGITDGLLKMIAAPDGTLVGLHVIGEGAAELVHIGQMALLSGLGTRVFVEQTFNFPTLAEAYRLAAMDIEWQREEAALAADGIRAS